MATLCKGSFDEDVIRVLREADEKGEIIPSLSQPCALCGLRVAADNKAGEWIPRTHFTDASV